MKKCEQNMQKVLKSNPSMGALDIAIDTMTYNQKLRAGVNNAKTNGRYSRPETRESFHIDKVGKLVGTTIKLEDNDTGEVIDVKVNNAEMIDNRYSRVNDGEYILDHEMNMTRNGQYMLGSENGFESEHIKMVELTGTVLQDVDDYFQRTVGIDKEVLTDTHKAHLQGIVDMYKNVLEEAQQDVNIDVEFVKDLNEANNTRGEADPELGKIKLFLGNQKNNSMTEVWVHELQHVLIKKAIEEDPELEYNITQLRGLIKEELVQKYGKGNGWKVFTDGKPEASEADAKKKWDYVFNNTKYPADEFLAYATTNEQMVKALEDISQLKGLNLFKEREATTVDRRGKLKLKPWETVWNAIVKTINTLYRTRFMKGKNAKGLVVDLLDTALRQSYRNNEAVRKGKMDQLLDGINNVDERIAKYTGAIDKEYKTYGEYLQAKEKDKLSNAINSVWKIRGLAKVRNWTLQNNLFSSVTRDTSNPDVAKFYEMFRKSKAFVEKEVVAIKNKTAEVLDKDYKLGKVSVEGKRALKRVLIDIDAQVLGTAKDIKEYLKDKKKVEDELDKITDTLDSDTVAAIENLAETLVTNKTKYKNGYVNATQIAVGMMGTRNKEVVEDIDRAVTLRAILLSSEQDKKLAVEAMEMKSTDPKDTYDIEESVDRMLTLYKTDQDKVLKEAYFGDKMYQVKGAKQESFKSDKKHYLVEEKEMKELVKAGLHNIGKHKELSRIIGKDIYTVVGDSTDVAYSEGLMSVIQLKSEGDSLKHLLKELGQMTEEEVDEKILELSYEEGIVEEALIPERSGNGEIYDYKLRLSHETKKDYLDMDDDIVGTIAGTVANLTHKQEAMVNNRSALVYLNKFYKEYKTSKEFKFVEISEDSEGKYKEYWDMMPHYMKRIVKKNMGGKLMVEQGMLVDFFGYQDVSLVNAPWIKDRKKRQLVAKKLEKIVQEMTKYWKKQIVAFTPATIQGNMGSNMLVAMGHTSYKNPVKYLEKFKDVWGMMNEYQADRQKKIELELKRDAGENISQKVIDGLEAKMRTNPIHVIIEDGQYTAILEDINTDYFDNKGIIEQKIANTLDKIKKDKSRENLKAMFDAVYIRKGSKLHDSVMKLTTYSDAINKMVILLDLQENTRKMKREGLDNKAIGQKLSVKTKEADVENFLKYGNIPQVWLDKMDGLHVNYGYLDNRFVKYMNDLGFVTFTKYFFRVFPAMVKFLGNKAFTVMLMEGARKGTGIGETPFEAFYNPFESLFKKFGLWDSPIDVFKDILTPAWVR